MLHDIDDSQTVRKIGVADQAFSPVRLHAVVVPGAQTHHELAAGVPTPGDRVEVVVLETATVLTPRVAAVAIPPREFTL